MTTQIDVPAIDPLANEARRAKRARVVRDNAACVLCGMANIDCLTTVKRSLLEAHHLVGRANDAALTAPVCRNCHAELTEGYRDAGVALNRPQTFLHQLVAVLRALGVMLIAVGHRLSAWAESLLQLIAGLDSQLPTWRTLAEVAA